MPKFTYAKGAIEKAKDEGLHLIVLAIDGKHAKKDSAHITGPVGPETAKLVWELFTRLCDVAKSLE